MSFFTIKPYFLYGRSDGDGFIITNYRADRVRELITSIFDKNFNEFKRKII